MADQPAMIIFQVRALRSVAGVAAPGAEIEIEPLGRKTVTDAAGNFVLRSLPPGTFKLTARSGGRATTKMVVLPDEPASMHDVNLMLSSGKPAPAPAMAAAKESSSQPAGAFVVQAGAFRKPSNASRVMRGMPSVRADAQISASNGSCVNAMSSAANTCSGVTSSG